MPGVETIRIDAEPGPIEVMLNRTALVIIDMQRREWSDDHETGHHAGARSGDLSHFKDLPERSALHSSAATAA